MKLSLYEVSKEYKAVFDIHPEDNNKVYVKVLSPDREMYDRVVACLYTSFSYKDPEATNSRMYKLGLCDGLKRLFDKKTNTLDTGLFVRACKMLRKGVPEIEIDCSPELSRIMKRDVQVSNDEIQKYLLQLAIKNDKDESVTPYEHQLRILVRGINSKRVSMVACTGAGKSLAQYGLSRWFMEKEHKKTLIIVPSAGLVEQMYSDFKNDYGWKDIDKHCTLIHSDSKDKLTKKQLQNLEALDRGEEVMMKDVVISTWQSLVHKEEKFFSIFGAVIVDEAHGAKADELKRIVNTCKCADWKIGLSGTIPDDGLDAALIEGSLGRRIEIVRSKELIAKTILTPVEIHLLMLSYKEDIRPYVCRQEYRDECTLFSSNGSRQKVFDVMVKANRIKETDNTLILFRRKESINEMKEYIETNYTQFKVKIIIGDIKASIRERYRNEIEQDSGHIVLATYGTMKQGVNIKRLHNLMFAEWSKSMYEIIQSIGRILRKHPTKEKAYVYDIVDNCSYITKKGFGTLRHNYAMQHGMHRLNYYNNEEFPVIEYVLPFEANIYPQSLDKKEKLLKNAESKSKKKVTKTNDNVGGKGDQSDFMKSLGL